MRIFQRGVLPPVNFAELDATLQGSLLSPAGARLVGNGDLTAALLADTLAPSGTRTIAFADLAAALQAVQLAPAGARRIAIADLATSLYAAGSFTPGWVGFSANPAGDFSWIVFGNVAYLFTAQSANMSGTSNSINFQFTGLPAGLQPARPRRVWCEAIDNNVQLQGAVDLGASGTVTVSLAVTNVVANRVAAAPAGWTSSGTKGLPGSFLATWPLL